MKTVTLTDKEIRVQSQARFLDNLYNDLVERSGSVYKELITLQKTCKHPRKHMKWDGRFCNCSICGWEIIN